jgi:hypothetical protein
MVSDTWNRSSALDPESLGRINSAIAQSVDALTGAAARHAEHMRPKVTLSDAQFAKLAEIIREAVADSIDKNISSSDLR